jgi:hypothetical protein
MTVPLEIPIASSVANGVTTSFPYAFTVLATGDLVVQGYLGGVTTVYTYGVHYTLTGLGDPAGSVEFVSPPANGTIITRYRDTEISRAVDYQTNGDLLAAVLNADLNRFVYILQEIFNGGKGPPSSIRAPSGVTLNPLPGQPSDFDGYYIGMAGGQPVYLLAPSGTAGALAGDLASTAVGKGDFGVGVKQTLTGASAMTQHQANEDRETFVGPSSDYQALGTAVGVAGKRRIALAAGTFSESNIVASQTQQHVRGMGWATDSATLPAATVLKNANGTHYTLGGDDSSLTYAHFDGATASYTGDGVQVSGTRPLIGYVSSVKQRGVGFRIGGAGATGVFNANLWRADRLVALDCVGDGCYIHHSGGTVTAQFPNGTPDVNAGVMVGGDFRNNGAIGLHLGNNLDNLYLGTVCQTNASKGVVLEGDSRGNVLIKPYSEANNSGVAGGSPPGVGPGGYGDEGDILAGAEANFVLGPRLTGTSSGSGWADRTTRGKNVIWAYDYQYGGVWVLRSQLDLANRGEDGSTTTDLNMWFGTNPTQAMRGRAFVTGSSGGNLLIQTKIDGGALANCVLFDANQRVLPYAAFVQKRTAPAYSASITIDAATTNAAEITATNATAFTIQAPTNPADGQLLTVTVRNTSGGALGAVTWNAVFKLAAWTQPANGFSRSITFRYNATNWVEISRTTADVPN